MGAVFSYSILDASQVEVKIGFQSLMGAVFSYSLQGKLRQLYFNRVSIPDGCSVQL